MKCYNCDREITPENWSLEHIINRSIGGHLHSRDLLCQPCNSKFGSGIDTALNKQLADYGFHLNIKLQWGNHEGSRYLSTLDGKKIRVAPGLVPYDKIREVNQDRVLWEYTVVPSEFESHMEQKERELKKKGQVTSSQYIVPPTKEKYFIISEGANAPNEVNFGGKDCFRSIAKICLNYYLHNKLPRKYIKTVLAFVKGESEILLPAFYYPTNEIIHILSPTEVSHIIHIRGDREQRILYAYIELFNFVRMIIPFSYNYIGRDINFTYSWDLINTKSLEKKLSLRLARHHLQDLPMLNVEMAQRMVPLRDRLIMLIESRCNSKA